VRDGLAPPGFIVCRETAAPIGDVRGAEDGELAQAHEAALRSRKPPVGDRASLLDVKIEMARRALQDCRLCPHECGVDRTAGGRGFCGVGPRAQIGAQMVHLGELPDLVPAYSVFLSGCTMRCVYCRKPDLLERPEEGEVLEPAAFAREVEEGAARGARTLKLLGGTPEPSVHALLQALRQLRTPLPLVWESTMFIAPQCLRLLRGVVDLFVANVRYGNDTCARELSGIDRYVTPAMEALREVSRWSDVTLRHLILPGHVECCTMPLAAMLEELLPDVELVLLDQYRPFWRAFEHPTLSRRLSDDERGAAIEAVSARKRLWRLSDLT